jgi:hypothetical protein
MTTTDYFIMLFIAFFIFRSANALCVYRSDMDYPQCTLPYSESNCPLRLTYHGIKIQGSVPTGYSPSFLLSEGVDYIPIKILTQEFLESIIAPNPSPGSTYYYLQAQDNGNYVGDGLSSVQLVVLPAPSSWNSYYTNQNAYASCHVDSFFSCGPGISWDYRFRSFNSTNPEWYLQYNSFNPDENAICICDVYLELPSVKGFDYNGLTIDYFLPDTNFTRVAVPACYEENITLSRSVRTVELQVTGFHDDSVYCDIGEVFGDKSIVVQRNTNNNATFNVIWNDQDVSSTFVTSSYWSWTIPDRIKIYGGIVSIMIVYPDMTYSQCYVDIKGEDKCDLQSDSEMTWECMSDEVRLIYVLQSIIYITLAVMLSVIMVIVLFWCMRTILNMPFIVRMCSGAGVIKVAEASTTENLVIADMSISTFALIVAVTTLVMMVLAILYKHRHSLKRKVHLMYSNMKKQKVLLPMNSIALMMLFGIGMAAACSNSIQLHSLGSKCSSNSCTIDKTFQFDLKYPGDCQLITSTSLEYPVSILFTYIASGYKFLTKDSGYSQPFHCTGAAASYCASGSSNHVDDCNNMNTYGSSCASIFESNPTFPTNTGSSYTKCGCERFPDSSTEGECDLSFVLTDNYVTWYSTPTPNGSAYPLLTSHGVIPYSLVSISFSNGTVDHCILTPSGTFCDWLNADVLLTQSESNVEITTLPTFAIIGDDHYFSDYSTDPAVSCGPNQIQLDSGATLTTGGQEIYKDLCSNYILSNMSVASNACKQTVDYMNLLPYMSETFGMVSSITIQNNTHYISTLSGGIGPISLTAQVNGDIRFNSTVQRVCPVVTDDTIDATGSCKSSSGGVFTINAYSTCFNGTAQLSCGSLLIKNPLLVLGDTTEPYKIYFSSDSCSGKYTCKLQASTSSTFKIDLSNMDLAIYYDNNNGIDYANYLEFSSANDWEAKGWSFIGFLIMCIVLCMIIAVGCLMLFCFISILMKFL